MAATILDRIESSEKIEIGNRARLILRPPCFKTFLYASIFGPFCIVASLFIPFLGQVLPLLGIGLFFVLCRAYRSWKLLFSGVIGAMFGIVILAILGSLAKGKVEVGGYIVLGLAMITVFTFIVTTAGAIWNFYQQGDR